MIECVPHFVDRIAVTFKDTATHIDFLKLFANAQTLDEVSSDCGNPSVTMADFSLLHGNHQATRALRDAGAAMP